MSTFHVTYRPQDFSEVLGQDRITESLRSYEQNSQWPHAFLLTGPAGTGKTTLARIIANKLNTSSTGLLEVDAATFNGVDTMRALTGDLQYRSIADSDTKFYILDECFAAGTSVSTPHGPVPIEQIKVGDVIYNLSGAARVKRTFATTVPIKRVVRVQLVDGATILCSDDHLFFTQHGWVKAHQLDRTTKVWRNVVPLPRPLATHRLRELACQKKTEEIGTPVVMVEPYHPDRPFAGLTPDARGAVTLYDLEIEGHPSYFANGCLVHNCHMLSKAAWNALLKATEEPPAHVYFAFCTTEPDKVPDTIKTRCIQYHLKAVPYSDLLELLLAVVDVEKLQVPEEGLGLIAREAFGSPRLALTMLSKCAYCQTPEQVREALETVDDAAEVIDLCRALVGRTRLDWRKAVRLVRRMEEKNPESIRLVVVNYIAKALLGTDAQNDAEKLLAVLDAFSTPFNPSEKLAPLLLAVGRLVIGGAHVQ